MEQFLGGLTTVRQGLVDMDKIGGGNLYVQSRVAKCTRARIFESPPYRPPDSSMCVTEQLLGFAEQAGAAQKGKAGTAPGRFNGRARRRGPRAHQDGAARRGEAGNRRTGNQSQETGRAQTAAGWRENCLLVLFSILYTSVYPPAKGRVIVEDSEKGEYRSQQVYSVS